MTFSPALTPGKGRSNPVGPVAMGAGGPTHNVDPRTDDCVDVSTAGREESRSYYWPDEVPGGPTTEIDPFMAAAGSTTAYRSPAKKWGGEGRPARTRMQPVEKFVHHLYTVNPGKQLPGLDSPQRWGWPRPC